MSAANDNASMLDVAELCDLLRVNRKTVYDAIGRGEIPGVVRLGRVLRFHRPTIDRWMTGEKAAAKR